MEPVTMMFLTSLAIKGVGSLIGGSQAQQAAREAEERETNNLLRTVAANTAVMSEINEDASLKMSQRMRASSAEIAQLETQLLRTGATGASGDLLFLERHNTAMLDRTNIKRQAERQAKEIGRSNFNAKVQRDSNVDAIRESADNAFWKNFMGFAADAATTSMNYMYARQEINALKPSGGS